MNAEALLVADLLATRAGILVEKLLHGEADDVLIDCVTGDEPSCVDEPAPPTVRSQA